MNGARRRLSAGGNGPSLIFDRSLEIAYCVPESGLLYKGQKWALANSPVMS
jgi:hypothetical protein